jgi:hypothetical protein
MLSIIRKWNIIIFHKSKNLNIIIEWGKSQRRAKTMNFLQIFLFDYKFRAYTFMTLMSEWTQRERTRKRSKAKEFDETNAKLYNHNNNHKFQILHIFRQVNFFSTQFFYLFHFLVLEQRNFEYSLYPHSTVLLLLLHRRVFVHESWVNFNINKNSSWNKK